MEQLQKDVDRACANDDTVSVSNVLSQLARDAPGCNPDAIQLLENFKAKLEALNTDKARASARRVNDEIKRRNMDSFDKKFLA